MVCDNRRHLDDMDYFRGFAILLVVLTHTCTPAVPSWYYFIVFNATVFFVFISGYFLSYLHNDSMTVIKFWRKKFYRVVIPYVFASLPGLMFSWTRSDTVPDFSVFIKKLTSGVIDGNPTLWFFPFIILVFACFPVWRYMIRHPRILLLSTIIALLVSSLTFRPYNNNNFFYNFIHFVGVFMAGLLATEYHNILTNFLRKNFWFVLFIGTTVCIQLMVNIEWGMWQRTMENQLLKGEFLLNVSLLSRLFLLLPLMALFLRLSDSGRSIRVLKILASMSFGIYMWHYYVIYFIDHNVSILMPHTLLNYIIRSIIVLVLTIGFLYSIKKISPRFSIYLGAPAD